MSNTEPDSTVPETPDDDGSDQGEHTPKALREAAERGKAAQAKAERLERENAFLKAGVDVTSPIGELLFDSYKGELTREAILERAQAVGAVGPQVTAGQPAPDADAQRGTASDAERAQTAARQQAAGEGAAPPETPSRDPHEVGLEAFEEGMKNGMKREDAAAAYFQGQMHAAAQGDERAIVRIQPIERGPEVG